MGLGFLRFFQRFRFGSHNYSHFVSGIGGAGAVIAAHTATVVAAHKPDESAVTATKQSAIKTAIEATNIPTF
jgi:hypothetical protein